MYFGLLAIPKPVVQGTDKTVQRRCFILYGLWQKRGRMIRIYIQFQVRSSGHSYCPSQRHRGQGDSTNLLPAHGKGGVASLSGLHQLLNLTGSGWNQWWWMRNYQVWEANRKVFGHPENWIEPQLLDNKSFLFELLEAARLQNEVNKFTAEDARSNVR